MSKRKPFKLRDDEIQALRDIVSINDEPEESPAGQDKEEPDDEH